MKLSKCRHHGSTGEGRINSATYDWSADMYGIEIDVYKIQVMRVLAKEEPLSILVKKGRLRKH